MQSTLSESDRLKGQTNQIFNIAEVPLMIYISEFLDEPPEIIFTEYNTNQYTEPLILLPLDDYKKNICLKFTLKPNQLESDTNRISFINDIVKYEKVREGIGFLNYCVKIVYNTILASACINNKPLINFSIDFDTQNWCFNLKYKSDITYKKEFLELSIQRISETLQRTELLTDIQISELKLELNTAIMELNSIQDTDTIDHEDDINKKYTNKVKLCIYIEDLHKDDLSNKSDKLNMNLLDMPDIFDLSDLNDKSDKSNMRYIDVA